MTRFLAVGDLHLDKGGRCGRTPGERLAEQEAVWARALELARERSVDAVLFAGDAFEKRHPSTDALLAFERPLLRHREQDGPRVIAIPGNHDRSGVSDFCALDVFSEAGLLQLYSRPDGTSVNGVTVACLPWAPVSRIVAAHDGGDRDDVNQVAAELLLETARGLCASSGLVLLLTHFSISGASTPDGMDVGLFREPVLQLADLEAVGFDAVIAGHIHKGQYLDEEERILYVGSPMPLDFGEAKCDHGCWIVEFDGDSLPTEFLPIESRRFLTVDYDATDPENPGVLEEIAAGDCSMHDEIPDAFVKLRYTATEEQARRIDNAALRDGLLAMGAHNVWIEPTIERELRARAQGLDESVSDVDALELWLESQSVNGDQAPAVRALHSDYLQEIS